MPDHHRRVGWHDERVDVVAEQRLGCLADLARVSDGGELEREAPLVGDRLHGVDDSLGVGLRRVVHHPHHGEVGDDRLGGVDDLVERREALAAGDPRFVRRRIHGQAGGERVGHHGEHDRGCPACWTGPSSRCC
jgi:hypothetical protein